MKNKNNGKKNDIHNISNNFLAIIGIVAICGFCCFIIFQNRNLNSESKKIIGENDITKKSYGYPIISLLSFNAKTVTVEAGYYRYGDVNLDGFVDKNDIDEIKHIINAELYFSESQIKLADVDENGEVNENDVKLFESYLEKNGPTKYDLNEDTLEYCASIKNNSSYCTWKKEKSILLEEKHDYYFFVRQKNTKVISEMSLLKKNVFDKKIPK